MNSFLMDNLPGDTQLFALVMAGIAVVLGLLLWSAGIKIARPLMAVVVGLALAGVGMAVLPALAGISVISSGLVGLAVGVLIGAVGFRLLQGVGLAVCVGVAACGAYYQVQSHRTAGVTAGMPAWELPVSQGKVSATGANGERVLTAVTSKQVIDDYVQAVLARWQAVPAALRQHMAVVGLSAGLVMLVVSWLVPRHITWVTTPMLGVGLLGSGMLFVLQAYVPAYQNWVPGAWLTRVGILAILVLVGMLVQRHLFWVRRRDKGPEDRVMAVG